MSKTRTYLAIIAISLVALTVHALEHEVAPETVALAKTIPNQSSHGVGVEKSWTCGPNSLARFLVMLGEYTPDHLTDNYYEFILRCPRSGGIPATNSGKFLAGCAAVAGSYFAERALAEGDIASACLATIGCLTAYVPLAIEGINICLGVGKVGPLPPWIAAYGSNLAPNFTIEHEGFKDSKAMIDTIKEQLLGGKPVIVLVKYALFAWHYINIIAIKDDVIKYLDTDGGIYEMKHKKLIADMDFEDTLVIRAIGTCLYPFGLLDKYNIIIAKKNNK